MDELKPNQVIINGEELKVLGKKIKLNKQEEFKGLNINDILSLKFKDR